MCSERRTNEGEAAISAKIFVGNLNFRTTKEELEGVLTPLGTVVDVYLPTDRATGKPRGFAFVQFSSDEEAARAIQQLNGTELGGRSLKVNAADDRPRRPAGPRPPSSSSSSSFTPSYRSAPAEPLFFGDDEGWGGKAKGSRRNLRARKRSL